MADLTRACGAQRCRLVSGLAHARQRTSHGSTTLCIITSQNSELTTRSKVESPGWLCNGSTAQIPGYQHWMGSKNGPTQSAAGILAAIFDL